MLYRTQWIHVRFGAFGSGASGSSTIKASERAVSGTPSQTIGGGVSFPSQVYLAGMELPEVNTGEVTVSAMGTSSMYSFRQKRPGVSRANGFLVVGLQLGFFQFQDRRLGVEQWEMRPEQHAVNTDALGKSRDRADTFLHGNVEEHASGTCQRHKRFPGRRNGAVEDLEFEARRRRNDLWEQRQLDHRYFHERMMCPLVFH